MTITVDQIRAICPFAPKNVDVFITHLNEFMPKYGIITIEQVRMFIAQVAHESGQLKYTQEIASGKAYEGRKDLGNVNKGDGVKFKGHGCIQITGRFNHEKVGKALGIDAINNPELLTTPKYAIESACWFWQSNNLNQFANDIMGCTKRINGGLNGFNERALFWERAKKVII